MILNELLASHLTGLAKVKDELISRNKAGGKDV